MNLYDIIDTLNNLKDHVYELEKRLKMLEGENNGKSLHMENKSFKT